MSNKSTGTKFEKEFAAALADHWFWVHLFQDNKNGQPCDVIACRNGNTYLFDCKDCQTDYFQVSRMEENQYNAMHLFELTGNSRGKFAVRFSPEEIYLVDYWQVKALKDQGVKKLSRKDCKIYGTEFSVWLESRNRIDGWSGNDADHNWE